MTNQDENMDLFPIPTPLKTTDLPIAMPLPGVTSASTAILRKLLSDNHTHFHCFFNDHKLHNHVSHTVIALWYLGADTEVLKAAYTAQTAYQHPSITSPGLINKANWTHYLGDDDYYNAYLAFFTSELAAKGPALTLEEYVFSDAANFPGGKDQVEMVNRFNEGLLHPLIHAGYGFEFGLPGMIAEGLAQAAVHEAVGVKLVPATLFEDVTKAHNATTNILDILARVIADSSITVKITDNTYMNMFEQIIQTFGDKIVNHVSAWTPDISTKESLQKTVEEVVFFINLMYAVPGLVSKEEGTFNADFYTMHFVTSSAFLSSILLHLKPRSQELLLKSYASVCLGWFVARGKPHLEIEAFFDNDSSLKPLLDRLIVARPSLSGISVGSLKSPNPWTTILDETLVHPDNHLPKLQRTLLHYAQSYGNIEPGHFKGTELKGAEKVDGTLFVRAANLTAFRLNKGEVKKSYFGSAESWWDRRGYFAKE